MPEPFFGKKYRKFDFVTQFLRNGSTKIQGFVLTVSGVTAIRSDHGVMSYIPDIGTYLLFHILTKHHPETTYLTDCKKQATIENVQNDNRNIVYLIFNSR